MMASTRAQTSGEPRQGLLPGGLMRDPSFSRSKTWTGAADDGRRRSNLPPGAFPTREHTITVARRYPSPGQKEFSGPSVWTMNPYKRLTKKTEDKVVFHLRKQLSRRIEKRINQLLNEEMEMDLQKNKERERLAKKKEQREERRSDRMDIYSQYNEFGEKITDHIRRKTSSEMRKRRAHPMSPRKSSRRSSGRSRSNSPTKRFNLSDSPVTSSPDSLTELRSTKGKQGLEGTETNEILEIVEQQTMKEGLPHELSHKAPLPDIGGHVNGEVNQNEGSESVNKNTLQTNAEGAKLINGHTGDEESKIEGGNSSNDVHAPSIPLDKREESIFELTRTNRPSASTGTPVDSLTKTTEEGGELDNDAPIDECLDVSIEEELKNQKTPSPVANSFRDLQVSPVPTPNVFRPMTREQSRIDIEDRMAHILQGRVDLKCPPDHKIIRIYISSDFLDTEVERTALMERVYPSLRDYCVENGCELQLLDLHWGLRDAMTDNHRLPEIFTAALENCQKTGIGIDFVSFLCQRYGSQLLPVTIPKEEFETIYKAAEHEKEIQVALANARASAARAAAAASSVDVDDPIAEEEEGDGSPIQSPRKPDKSSRQSPVKRQTNESPDKRPEKNDKKKRTESTSSVSSDHEEPDPSKLTRRDTLMIHNAIREAELDPNLDPNLLKNWYKLDENAVPPVYTLQNISSHFENFIKTDASKRSQARSNWFTVARKLQKLLKRFSTEVFGDDSFIKKFLLSVQDMEIEQGLVDSDDPDTHCLWFTRRFTNINNNLEDENAKKYVDMHPVDTSIDEDLQAALEDLTNARVKPLLEKSNIHEYSVLWNKAGIKPTFRNHTVYLEHLCADFQEAVTQSLNAQFQLKGSIKGRQEKLFDEVSQHVNFCHEKAQSFHGRKDLLQQIKTYTRSTCNTPLVIYGKSGSGKTALMAKSCKEAHKWFKGKKVSILARFIGVTGQSANVRLLLRGICHQLCEIYGGQPENVPDDYKGLLNDFGYRISKATAEKPLVIMIDSLNQLTDENDARNLAWLPKELPEHVHVVVSTLPDEKYDCLQKLRKFFPDNQECFVEVPELPFKDALTILDHWFKRANRTLTPHQYDVLIDVFKQCPLPLCLKVAFQEACLWSSYMSDDHVKLSNTVKKIATVIFGRVEKNYGETVVRRSLGYLTAAKNGVTQSEMEDLLSLDEVVMNDIEAHYKLPIRRCPPIMWQRIRHDLRHYIMEISSDNCKTMQWFHVQFKEAAEERYLKARDKQSFHKALAEYFLGKWANIKKPHSNNNEASLRYVAAQPMYFKNESKNNRIYNLRKLNELPHHLINSQQMDVLKTECLCNFEWVLAKLCATSLRAVLDDYYGAMELEPKDLDFKLISDSLQLSSKVLYKDPTQLASQIVGRLHHIISHDVPTAPQDPLKYAGVHPFFKQAHHGSVPALIPSATCLTAPGGLLFDLLSGHNEPITSVTVTIDGLRAVTTAKDDTMKLWDLRSGRVTKTIPNVGSDVVSVKLGNGNKLAITSEMRCIRIWDLNQGKLVKTMDDHDDLAFVTTAGQGNTLICAFFDGANRMKTWDSENGLKEILNIGIGNKGIRKDHSIAVASNAFGEQVTYAHRGLGHAQVINARSGKLVHNLKCANEGAAVEALGTTSDYFVIACRYGYMKLHELCMLELFDVNNGKYLRSVRGCTMDHVEELFINQLGSHAMCICHSNSSNTSNIAVWNLETEDHKHLAHHAGTSKVGACADFRFCLTAGPTDSSLRIWNLTHSINKPAPKLKKTDGIEEIIPMKENARYIVARAMNNGPVTVWNVAKAKCKGNAVRIERGLSENTDVMLVRNTLVTILTDRGVSVVSEDATQVFQSVLTYDLKNKKYVGRLHGLFITCAPQHEYALLNDNRLLSPSDNRTHLIVWSLESGKILYRIKPNFKDRLLDISMSKVPIPKRKRDTTAKMTPWERRAETQTARQRRHHIEEEEDRRMVQEFHKEKENAIEQYILSEDEKVIVASYYAHHLCIFEVETQKHKQTLENENSMLLLHTAALTYDGSHLAHANYDDATKTSYVTLWDCNSGTVRKRLKNEKNVCAMAVSKTGDRIVFGKENNELRIWEPFAASSLRRVKGYPGLKFGVGNKIFLVENATRAVVYAGDISLWDLSSGEVLAVFTPDMAINTITVAMDDKVIAFGLRDSSNVVTLKLLSRYSAAIESKGHDMFGEASTSSESEDDEY